MAGESVELFLRLRELLRDGVHRPGFMQLFRGLAGSLDEVGDMARSEVGGGAPLAGVGDEGLGSRCERDGGSEANDFLTPTSAKQ